MDLCIDVVIPPSSASGLLAELAQKDDLFLDDSMKICAINGKRVKKKTHSTITFFTSGSTGKPKAIPKTIAQINTEIKLLHRLWGTSTSPMVYATVPHHHIYGLIFSLLWPACAGYGLQTQTHPFWESLLEESTEQDWLISSPAHLSRLPQQLPQSFASWTRIFSAGAPLTQVHALKAKDLFGALPTEILGSTETGAIASRYQDHENQPWSPLPGITLSVDDDKRMKVRSPYVAEKDGYQTEDIIEFVGENQFYLKGRADRIVKIEGKRLCLTEMENRLLQSGLFEDVVVILLDPEKRNGVVGVLSMEGARSLHRQGKLNFIRSVCQILREFFDLVVLPRRWRFVENIPMDSRGKRSFSLLQDMFHDSL